ncbi:Protein kinase domain-containing protein [Fusarium falciforme]|uniref:Protein kinase domain-containing protein n=1 Tax=Fusarium falciforme TaxID=195108 RepID=UPI002301B6BA|nr:Protein kinase domain-containing protein [Fusarium falciforme]WAO95552.1 Protein kinase domain-containing protein [Fusarium falciforme]
MISHWTSYQSLGYHQDESDHLVIPDFSLTEFKSFWSRSIPGYSGTYKLSDLDFDDKITQKYDIWSLGCVFLELASWLLLDGDAPTTFSDKRLMPESQFQGVLADDRFFYLETTDESTSPPKVKLSVLEWIQSLHALNTCPGSIHDFLDIIQKKMLQPKAADRSDSRILRRELGDIYHRCVDYGVYTTKGEALIVPKDFAAPTHQESSQSEEQPDLYPKVTVEMQRSSSVGRRLGLETKPGDAGEGAQAVESGFEE